MKTCLTSRYPCDRYILMDKLTGNFINTEADICPFFESQLEVCEVDYLTSISCTRREWTITVILRNAVPKKQPLC